jgi:hypothetical protein
MSGDRSIKPLACVVASSPSTVVNTIKPTPVGNAATDPNSSKNSHLAPVQIR